MKSDTNKDIFGDILPIPHNNVDALHNLITELKDCLPIHLEFMAIRAQMNFELYRKHVEAGFSEAQAMEIVKIKGI